MRVVVAGRHRTTCEGIAAGLSATEGVESDSTARTAAQVLRKMGVRRRKAARTVVIPGRSMGNAEGAIAP